MQAIATDGPNEAASFTCRQLNVPYFRFNPTLPERVSMSEVDTKRLIEMILHTKRYCNEMAVRDQLAHVVQLLHAAVRAEQSQAMYISRVSDRNGSK